VETYFKAIDRTRRALARTGELSEHDIERMEIHVGSGCEASVKAAVIPAVNAV
jgi:hypothetical protein